MLIFGPYGHANIGDNAILKELKSLLDLNCTFDATYTNASPWYLKYPNIRKLKIGVFINIQKYSCVIVGGGEQLQDPTIPNPIYGMLQNVFYLCLLCKLYKIKFILLGVGIEKNLCLSSRLMLKYILNNSCYSSFRDKKSLSIAQKYGKITNLSYDSVWGCQLPKLSLKSNRVDILFVPQKHKKFKNIHFLKTVDAIKQLSLSQLKFKVLTTDRQKKIDLSLIDNLVLSGVDKATIINNQVLSYDDLILTLHRCKFVITFRMHVIIGCLLTCTPFIAVSHTSKIKNLLDDVGIKRYITMDYFYDNALKISDLINNYQRFSHAEIVCIKKYKMSAQKNLLKESEKIKKLIYESCN